MSDYSRQAQSKTGQTTRILQRQQLMAAMTKFSNHDMCEEEWLLSTDKAEGTHSKVFTFGGKYASHAHNTTSIWR
jgi:hypothetical protein